MELELDLDLENYSLQELLNLFKLKNNFTINDLKITKKMVMLMHPDKSGLEKEYFLFYCKAFRMLKDIYEIRNKRKNSLNNENSKIEYLADDEDDKGKRLLVENLLKKDKEDFHIWFNKSFEKINIVEEERENGYGEWFKSNDDIDTTETTYNMMNQKISEKKEKLSAIIKKTDIMETGQYLSSQNYKELDSGVPESYSSNMFSSLPFEDLKKAHTETVVPVSNSDYNKIKKFNNLESYRRERNSQNTKPLTQEEANKYINNKEKLEDNKNIKLAYKLTREEEKTSEANNSWWSNLRLLQ